MNKVLATVFKGIATVIFFIFLGGIIFRITHMDLEAKEIIKTENIQSDGEELIYNSEFAKTITYEISNIDGVNSVAIFEIDDKVLVGIETKPNVDTEYLNGLENFIQNTVMEYGIKPEKIFVEINGEISDEIAELSYYAAQGVALNILNSRFENIYEGLVNDYD